MFNPQKMIATQMCMCIANNRTLKFLEAKTEIERKIDMSKFDWLQYLFPEQLIELLHRKSTIEKNKAILSIKRLNWHLYTIPANHSENTVLLKHIWNYIWNSFKYIWNILYTNHILVHKTNLNNWKELK